MHKQGKVRGMAGFLEDFADGPIENGHRLVAPDTGGRNHVAIVNKLHGVARSHELRITRHREPEVRVALVPGSPPTQQMQDKRCFREKIHYCPSLPVTTNRKHQRRLILPNKGRLFKDNLGRPAAGMCLVVMLVTN